MAQTIQNLFPKTDNRAEDFTVYPCCLKFSAPIIAGKYVFSRQTTPPQEFGKLLQGQKGVIAGLMISANTTEENFTSAVNDFLLLQILHDGNKTPVNMAPFPFANFAQVGNFQEQWEPNGATVRQEEYFSLDITGTVDQLTGMSLNELELKVVFNFIRVGADKLKG